MKYFIFVLTVSLVFTASYSQTQSDKDKAQQLCSKAIALMERGYFNQSIDLLEEARELDPSNITYPYEMSYACYLNEDYDEAIKILEKIKNHKDSDPLIYEVLGNAYDMTGEPKKAASAYYQGIGKFPKSGRLYFEIGILHGRQANLDSAVKNWEKAIEVQPDFPSPYYQLARIFSFSTEKIWTLIYGEIFINLEKKTKRTLEISKLLYDTYKNNLTYKGDTLSVSFSKVSRPETIGFSTSYELVTLMSLLKLEKKMSISFLNKMRTKFIQLWDSSKYAEKYDLVLFDWHKKLIDKGYFEAYNYWLFNAGEETEFKKWHKENDLKFREFDQWMGDNALAIDSTNYFVRSRMMIIQN